MNNNDREIASAVRNALAERLGTDRFDVWFGSDVRLALSDGRLQIRAGDEFRAERLRRNFRHDLAAACRDVLGRSLDLEFCVMSGSDQEAAATQSDDPRPQLLRLPTAAATTETGGMQAARGRNPLTFVVGPEHKIAHTSAEMVLQEPGKFTPLFIYGPTGSGKSHFLETFCSEARRRSGLRRIVSVTAEQFTTQFLEALQGSGLPNFRRKYRDLEMLIIDDLQFFSGKKNTLVELQTTIDTLLREHRQLVLSADRSPAELAGFSQLLGRLSGGLVSVLPHPEAGTRRRIAQQLADAAGGLADDVLDLLAQRFAGDARQLAGAVNRLTAVSQALGRTLNVADAANALEDLFRAGQRTVRLADIQQAICDVFGLDKSSLQSGERRKQISQPRMLAMWLARRYTRAGMSEICRFFGRRSHSTVVSAERQVQRWLSHGTNVQLAHGQFPIEDAIRRVEAQLRTG